MPQTEPKKINYDRRIDRPDRPILPACQSSPNGCPHATPTPNRIGSTGSIAQALQQLSCRVIWARSHRLCGCFWPSLSPSWPSPCGYNSGRVYLRRFSTLPDPPERCSRCSLPRRNSHRIVEHIFPDSPQTSLCATRSKISRWHLPTPAHNLRTRPGGHPIQNRPPYRNP